VENAFKFASSRIDVDVSGEGADVTVTVVDDGLGIPAADLPNVFDRFHRSARTPARQMGSGLGLAIVAELVRAMGGSVEADSPCGGSGGTGGTKMVVRFKRSVPGPPDNVSASSSSSGAGSWSS